MTVGYSADYENVTACVPLELVSDVVEGPAVQVATAIGSADAVTPTRWIVDSTEGVRAVMTLRTPTDQDCEPISGFWTGDVWRFVGASATFDSLDEARAWLDLHADDVEAVLTSFRVLEPWT